MRATSASDGLLQRSVLGLQVVHEPFEVPDGPLVLVDGRGQRRHVGIGPWGTVTPWRTDRADGTLLAGLAGDALRPGVALLAVGSVLTVGTGRSLRSGLAHGSLTALRALGSLRASGSCEPLGTSWAFLTLEASGAGQAGEASVALFALRPGRPLRACWPGWASLPFGASDACGPGSAGLAAGSGRATCRPSVLGDRRALARLAQPGAELPGLAILSSRSPTSIASGLPRPQGSWPAAEEAAEANGGWTVGSGSTSGPRLGGSASRRSCVRVGCSSRR